MSIAQQFNKYFSIHVANTDELRTESFKIRHKVYSEEFGWEPRTSAGIETDECDHYSVALLLKHKRTGNYAGTARLVIPHPLDKTAKLPFETHCIDTIQKREINLKKLPRGSFGEISRLAVPADFRRRLGEKEQPYVINEVTGDVFSENERSSFPNISMGLYMGLIALEGMCNHSHMFVVVEPRLQRRLKRLGLHFIQCGDVFEYHGKRALYFLPRRGFTQHLNSEMLELFKSLENSIMKQLSFYPYLPLMRPYI